MDTTTLDRISRAAKLDWGKLENDLVDWAEAEPGMPEDALALMREVGPLSRSGVYPGLTATAKRRTPGARQVGRPPIRLSTLPAPGHGHRVPAGYGTRRR